MRWIYVLRDPRSGWARYVGCSDDLERRLKKHVVDARRPDDRSPRARWIRGLLARNLKPEIEAVARVKRGDDEDEKERTWIRALLDEGAPLTNVRGGARSPAKARRAPRAVLALRRAERAKRVAEAARERGDDRSAAPQATPPPTPQAPPRVLNRFGHFQDASGRWRTPRGPRGRGRARRLRSELS